MRALTQEQVAVLSRMVNTENDLDDQDPVIDVCISLVERGCAVLVDRDDGWLSCEPTPLGRLAIRVSRPEMAFTVPT